MLFNSVRDFLREYVVGEYPEWTSPFVHAFDTVYRDELNVKIEVLDAQIKVLNEEIERLKCTS
jgi:hypothetical protein